MSDTNKQTHRSYNDFSNKAIYTAQGKPSDSTGWQGWRDEYSGDTVSTPITAENLNAMLNMLIDIRNVIGKTGDFATSVNGTDLSIDTGNVTHNDDGTTTINTNDSLGKYLEKAFEAIIGNSSSAEGQINDNIKQTLSGLKTYLESLDVSNESNEDDINNSGDHRWVNRVTQTDGLIDVEYAQPKASDIINDSSKYADKTTLNSVIDEIVGSEVSIDGQINENILPSLTGLKTYLESLDSTLSADTSKWINGITQDDGKITSVSTKQPDAKDITYTKEDSDINIKDKGSVETVVRTLDKLIGKLSDINLEPASDSETVTSVNDLVTALNNEAITRNNQINALDYDNNFTNEDKTISANSLWIKAIKQTDGKIKAISSQPKLGDIDSKSSELTFIRIDPTDDNPEGIKYTINEDNSSENLKELLQATIDALVGPEKGDADNTIRGAKRYAYRMVQNLDNGDQVVNDKKLVTNVYQEDGKVNISRETITPDYISDFEDSVKTIEVNSAINATNDSNGKNISDTYATKEEVSAIELLDSKVKMSDNLRITETFGKYKPDTSLGYIDILCKDKTIREFLLDALQVASTGSFTSPAYSFTVTADSSGEVGTFYNQPSATFKVTGIGKYPYGPDTGIKFSGKLGETSFTDKGLNSTISESFGSAGMYADSAINESISLTDLTHSKAINPANTNIGTQSNKYIESKDYTNATKSTTFTGYRKAFAGATTAITIDSSIVRGSSNSKNSKASMDSEAEALNFTASKGSTKIFFAYPSTWTGTPYFEMFGLAWAAESSFKQATNIDVADARGNDQEGNPINPKSYKLYVWECEPLQSSETKFRVWFK